MSFDADTLEAPKGDGEAAPVTTTVE